MPMQSRTGSRSSGGPMRRPQASRSPPPACARRSRAAGRCCTTSRSRCGRASWWRSSAAAVQGRRCCSRRWRASAPPSGARCASTASTSTPTSTPSAAFSATSRRTTSFTPSCRSSGLSGTRRGCACRRRSPRRRSTRPSRERSPRSTSQSGRHVRVGALSGGQRKRASFAVELLAREATPEEWARRFEDHRGDGAVIVPAEAAAPRSRTRAGFVRQWSVLTRRNFETLARNPLTMAILLGSPALVVAMFAILFRPGAFDFADPNPSAIAMILFWVTFGAFFFGLTYGLLQIVAEQAILRREHLVGQRLSAYLLAKIAVLLPFLLLVIVLMLGLLRLLERLPPASARTYLTVGVSLALDAAAALTLGLLTSAAVGNPAQATLALPMLCFPAVLFSGAILPVNVMAGVGAAISAVIPVRWAFEAIGHDLGVRAILAHGGSPLGPPLLHAYGDAGLHSTTTYWAYLTIFGVVLFAAAWATLTVTADRSPR